LDITIADSCVETLFLREHVFYLIISNNNHIIDIKIGTFVFLQNLIFIFILIFCINIYIPDTSCFWKSLYSHSFYLLKFHFTQLFNRNILIFYFILSLLYQYICIISFRTCFNNYLLLSSSIAISINIWPLQELN